MKWKVYYSDGTIITDEDATPFSIAKRVGVQAIIQEDKEKGWLILPPNDYYMWDARGGEARWFPGDWAGFFQYIIQPGSKATLLGEWVDNERYREIYNKANDDRYFLNDKSGYYRFERKP